MQALRHSSWLTAAMLPLVGASVLGAVEHQVTAARAGIVVNADHLAVDDCEPGQALHLDPSKQTQHDCVVCRLGSKSLSPSAALPPGVTHIEAVLPSPSSAMPASRWLACSPSRAPPVF